MLMTITDFGNDYVLYENMSIWEVKSLPDFFKAHEDLLEIFEKEYGFAFDKLSDQKDFNDSDIMVISKLLDQFGDKFFYVFSNNDTHHNELKILQDNRTMNFGMDIYVIHPSKIYVLEMDKTKDLKMYDR